MRLWPLLIYLCTQSVYPNFESSHSPLHFEDLAILLGLDSYDGDEIGFLRGDYYLSRDFYDRHIGTLIQDGYVSRGAFPVGQDEFQSLRLVSIRHEESQLRLVFQPYHIVEKKFLDGAIHVFFNLPVNRLKHHLSLLGGLRSNLSKLSKKKIQNNWNVLGVHTAFDRQVYGTNGQRILLAALRHILEAFRFDQIESPLLSQVTFMKLLMKDGWWQFGGVEKRSGRDDHFVFIEGVEWDRISIARYGEQNKVLQQDFFNNAYRNNGLKMRGVIVPIMDDNNMSNNLSHYIADYSGLPADKDKSDAIAIIKRIQSPQVFKESQVDCVHCHILSASESYLLQRRENNYSTKSMRMFGYFDDKPQVSIRVKLQTRQELEKLLKAK